VSHPAQGGSVRVSRRDTLDEKLGFRFLRAVEIEGEASVFLEHALQVREHIEGDGQLGFDVAIVGVRHSANLQKDAPTLNYLSQHGVGWCAPARRCAES